MLRGSTYSGLIHYDYTPPTYRLFTCYSIRIGIGLSLSGRPEIACYRKAGVLEAARCETGMLGTLADEFLYFCFAV